MSKEKSSNLSKVFSNSDTNVDVTNSTNNNNSNNNSNNSDKVDIDQNALLQGYTAVDQANWDKILYKTHIRYLRTDGQFRKGGYVVNTIHTTDREGKPTIKIDLVSNFGPNAIKWSLYKGSIKKIWSKVSEYTESPSAHLAPLKEDIEFCKKSIEQLCQKIQQMENENIRILNLIKKLHNIT